MKLVKKHRKLFYVPGMISLVALPLLCLFYFSSDRNLRNYQCIDILVSSSVSDVKPNKNSNDNGIGYVPKRNYFTYEFNDQNDEKKLSDANVKIVQLIKSQDSINGVKFSFNKQSTYATFINVLDQLAISEVSDYTVFENSIFVFFVPFKKNSTAIRPTLVFKCGYYEANKSHFDQLKIEENRRIFIANLKRFWMIVIAFFGLCIVNIYSVIRRNRRENYV